MSKTLYPAVFHEENNSYWVEFPDLPGCFSDGNTLEDAFTNAHEALGMYLDKSIDIVKFPINKPSNVSKIIAEYQNLVVMLIEYDSLEYAKKYKNKAVKKTLTIPEWLNDAAVKKNINFSSVLQDALIKELKL